MFSPTKEQKTKNKNLPTVVLVEAEISVMPTTEKFTSLE